MSISNILDTAQSSDGRWRPSVEEWVSVVEDYREGALTVQKIADKYKISHSQLKSRMKKANVKHGSRYQDLADAAKNLDQKEAEQAAKVRAQRIKESQSETYNLSRAIAALTTKCVSDHAKGIKSIAKCKQELTALRHAATICDLTWSSRAKALDILKGLPTDQEALPSLEISEMSAAEELDISRAPFRESMEYSGDASSSPVHAALSHAAESVEEESTKRSITEHVEREYRELMDDLDD